jgi:hypothetical protein
MLEPREFCGLGGICQLSHRIHTVVLVVGKARTPQPAKCLTLRVRDGVC